MSLSGALARPMLAGVFVYGGVDALRHPEDKAKAADDVAPMIAEALHLPMTDTITLVRINGAIQVAAGTMLALGKGRRIAALTLAASLVPTTYAGHRYWEEVDEAQRARHRIHFLKNLAILGGLLVEAADTGGRPSIPWQARRAARHAVEAAGAAGTATEEAAKQIQDQIHQIVREAQQVASGQLGRRARRAAKKARRADLAALAAQARQLAKSARESDLSKRARKAARHAAKKAQKADLPRRARKMAQQIDAARLSEWAATAAATARQAAHEVPRVSVPPAAEAAARLQQTSGDALEWARDWVREGGVGQVRDSATAAAQQLAARAKEALPTG